MPAAGTEARVDSIRRWLNGSLLCGDRVAQVNLFAATDIGTVKVSDRTAVAPMTRVSAADDGSITGAMAEYYEEFARGGWGLVETEATYIDTTYSQCRDRQPGMATPAQRETWRRIVDAVHAHGAAIFMQLQHAGALAEVQRNGAGSVAPSAVPPRSPKALPLPRELSSGEVEQICDSFAGAAARAVEAGFD